MMNKRLTLAPMMFVAVVGLGAGATQSGQSGPDGRVPLDYAPVAVGQVGHAYQFFTGAGRAELSIEHTAGIEYAVLLHAQGERNIAWRAGNPDPARPGEIESLSGAGCIGLDPYEVYWVSVWFKRPGWTSGAAWQQAELILHLDIPGGMTMVGVDDPTDSGERGFQDVLFTINRPGTGGC